MLSFLYTSRGWVLLRSHQDRPVLQELSHSHRIGLQTLRSQCGPHFGLGIKVMDFMKVGMKVRDGMTVSSR